MERAFPTMALFRQALLAKVGDEQAAGKCPELTGKDANGQPLQFEHRHAHFIPLCLEGDDPKRIDHVLVYAPMGFGELAEDALRRLRKTWAKGIEDIRVTLIGIGKLQEFRSLSGELVPELGTAKVWVSRTPFFPPRFLKVRGKDTIEGQVRAEVLRRGLPDLEGPPVIAIPREDNPAGRRALRFRRFVRTRQGKASRPPAGPLHLTIEFCQPVQGPLCLGWGAHFGLGLFVPDEGEISSGL
jgi:CRISPR-associated protein Csb2